MKNKEITDFVREGMTTLVLIELTGILKQGEYAKTKEDLLEKVRKRIEELKAYDGGKN
jgi:hypothetical protein